MGSDIDFHSLSSEGTHVFYEKFAEGYIIVKYRSSFILVAICKILAELWPFFDLIFLLDYVHRPLCTPYFDTLRGILILISRDKEEDQ